MDNNGKTILIAEDNRDLLNLLKINLTDQSYQVITATDGKKAMEAFHQEQPGLVILDVMMPEMDGFDVCKAIRSENKQVPILMLTAKTEEVDKVLGLEIGADDYMTKPFSIRELLARVKAIFRRVEVGLDSSVRENSVYKFDGLMLDVSKRKVTLNGRPIELTSKEYDLLHLFFSNPGKAYSREELLNTIWGYSFEGYSHTVNSHINRLRSKIEDDASDPHYIRTVWGVGYRFADLEEAEV
ncbi:response regulator transcription factor [Rhodohalobacter mucosus]|uniref:Phosphate regulon transcriptional regulatory protein PhoB n=1 Tax=Rhodohalobacter mucosus TaxID=2079485 RepID=A0A316TNX1_9BACT|nr:response regulator transcription factor [Rhodohalobacter mucosus]PWN06307.1 DNA-binding response regulator [Rhodohalobacter mucosus]